MGSDDEGRVWCAEGFGLMSCHVPYTLKREPLKRFKRDQSCI